MLERITAQQEIIDSIAVDEDLITKVTNLDGDIVNFNDAGDTDIAQQNVNQSESNSGYEREYESIVPDVTNIDFINVPHQEVPDDMILIPVLDSDIKEAELP